MRREFLFGTVFAAAMAVGVGAQTGTSQSTASNDYGQGGSVTVTGCLQSASTFQSGTTGTSGSTAANPASSAMNKPADANFVLTNVSKGSSASEAPQSSSTYPSTAESGSAAGSATGTSGSSSSVPGSSAAMNEGNALWLTAMGNKDNDWSKYIDHRVEIRGTLSNGSSDREQPPASSQETAGTSGSATGSTAGTTGSTAGTSGSVTGSASGTAGSDMQSSASANGMGTLRVDSIKDLGSCSSR